MALRKMLSGRFLHLAKHSSTRAAAPSPPAADRKVLQRRAISQSATWLTLPAGDKLIEIIRSSMRRDRDKIQLDALAPPPAGFKPDPDEDHGECANRVRISVQDELMQRIRSSMWRDGTQPNGLTPLPPAKSETEMEGGITTKKVSISVQDARKFLQASRIEIARAKLRAIPKSRVSYSDFVLICREIAGGSDDVAAALEKSGAVIVLGDIVFLRPEQVAWAIENAILPQPISDPRRSELREMEAEKTAIDGKAGAQVRRELWAGLGFGLLQTAGFMRLTFWELSWDVMEPICFFAASFYFMMGWAFFMRTSKEPSFEGFFAGRFATKQKRLMKAHRFDLRRFNELKSALVACYQESNNGSCAHLHSCDCHCQGT